MSKKFLKTTTAITLIIGGMVFNIKPAHTQEHSCIHIEAFCRAEEHMGPDKRVLWENECKHAYEHCVEIVGSIDTPSKDQCNKIKQKCNILDDFGCEQFARICHAWALGNNKP